MGEEERTFSVKGDFRHQKDGGCYFQGAFKGPKMQALRKMCLNLYVYQLTFPASVLKQVVMSFQAMEEKTFPVRNNNGALSFWVCIFFE